MRTTRRRAAESLRGRLRDGSRKWGLLATIQTETEREILALVGRTVSILGELGPERAHFHCDRWGLGFSPRYDALGLADSTLSPPVTRMIGIVGAMVSFAEGQQLLQGLAAVDLDAFVRL